jgi:hypothetical protein
VTAQVTKLPTAIPSPMEPGHTFHWQGEKHFRNLLRARTGPPNIHHLSPDSEPETVESSTASSLLSPSTTSRRSSLRCCTAPISADPSGLKKKISTLASHPIFTDTNHQLTLMIKCSAPRRPSRAHHILVLSFSARIYASNVSISIPPQERPELIRRAREPRRANDQRFDLCTAAVSSVLRKQTGKLAGAGSVCGCEEWRRGFGFGLGR